MENLLHNEFCLFRMSRWPISWLWWYCLLLYSKEIKKWGFLKAPAWGNAGFSVFPDHLFCSVGESLCRLLQFTEAGLFETVWQVKYYNYNKRDHCQWGNSFNSIEYECKPNDTRTLMWVNKETFVWRPSLGGAAYSQVLFGLPPTSCQPRQISSKPLVWPLCSADQQGAHCKLQTLFPKTSTLLVLQLWLLLIISAGSCKVCWKTIREMPFEE